MSEGHVVHHRAAVEGEQEVAREQHQAEQEVDAGARRVAHVLEYSEIHDRIRCLQLMHDERDQADRGNRDQGHDRRGVPAVAVALFEHVLQRGHADRQKSDAKYVDRRLVRLEAGLLDDARAHDGDDHAERHVDQEHPVPVEPFDQVGRRWSGQAAAR